MNQLTVHTSGAPSIYSNDAAFDHAQRMAKALSSSDLVPTQYKGNIANTLIALEMANRTGSSPIMVMQNLNVIEGNPSWASTFVIAALNSCGRFTPIRFRYEDKGQTTLNYETWEGPKGQRRLSVKTISVNNKTCVAYAYDKNGELIEGPSVSIEMAVMENWYTKPGTKWKTMPDLMLSYRAATFFGRLYAPDILQGMHTAEEVQDFSGGYQSTSYKHEVQKPAVIDNLNKSFQQATEATGRIDDAVIVSVPSSNLQNDHEELM